MNRIAFLSLKTRLTLILLLALLVPASMTAWLAYDSMAETIRAERIRSVIRIADMRHMQLKMVLDRAINRSYGLLIDLRRHCTPQANGSCIRELLRTYASSEGALGVELFQAAGQRIAFGESMIPADGLPPFAPGQQARFETQRAGARLSYYTVAIDPTTGARLAVTYPVEIIKPLFESHTDLGQSGETFLADAAGFFITPVRYKSTQGRSIPVSAQPMQHCLSPANGNALDLDYRDVPIIHGFRFVPEIGGGCIMAHIDQAEAFAPIRTLQHQFIAALLLLSGLAVAVAHLVAGRMADSLRESEARYRSLFENANTAIASTDASGRLTSFNEAFRALLGYTADHLQQMHFSDFTHPDDLKLETVYFDEILSGRRQHYRIEKRYLAKDGATLWVDLSVSAIRDQSGQVTSFFGVIADITERRLAQQKLDLMATVFTNSGEAIIVTDANNAIVMVNAAFTRLTGYAIDDVAGLNPKVLSAGRTSIEVYQEMWHALNTSGTWEGELWDRRKSGEIFPKWLSIAVVKDASGRIENYVGSFVDISERKASEERIRHLAYHDPLTNLPNRFSLNERLAQALGSARRNDRRLALLLIDLDNFKIINDTLGHQAGDQLLIQVAERLGKAVRDSDVVARLGGDEFVVVLLDVDSPSDAAYVADKIVRSVGQPYRIGEQELRTSPSIGICF